MPFHTMSFILWRHSRGTETGTDNACKVPVCQNRKQGGLFPALPFLISDNDAYHTAVAVVYNLLHGIL